MNVLILGSGGREHTMAWMISQSPQCHKLFIAPGNAGTLSCGTNVALDPLDFKSIKNFALEHHTDIIVVGPEAPLVAGIVDYFSHPETAHIQIVGPDAHAAQLEGSKAFAKEFMKKYAVPTASYTEVTAENIDAGIDFLRSLSPPYVLKADGLASGKGVLILDDLEEAIDELKAMLSGKFGKASEKVVIETFLKGIEFSVFVLTDGRDYLLLPEAKDYKRIGEGDSGLNTGGMGAVSPVPFVDEELRTRVRERIIIPTIKGLAAENMNYRGFVFFGLINVNGDPYVIEYNCRMGDPETEVVLPRVESDLLEMFSAMFEGRLSDFKLKTSTEAAAAIMMVSGGYPGDFEKNKLISGLGTVNAVRVFHAGTQSVQNQVRTNGGRVLAVTSMDTDLRKAIETAVRAAEQIDFEGKYFRRDIGFDL
jgi:phosphoribosylamine---glycine ligase